MLNWADSIMNSLSQYSLFWSLMTLRSRDKKTVVKNNQVYSSCVLNSQDIYRLHHNLLKPLYLSYPTIFGLKQITSQPSQNMPCWAPSVPVKLQQLVQSKVVNKRMYMFVCVNVCIERLVYVSERAHTLMSTSYCYGSSTVTEQR